MVFPLIGGIPVNTYCTSPITDLFSQPRDGNFCSFVLMLACLLSYDASLILATVMRFKQNVYLLQLRMQ